MPLNQPVLRVLGDILDAEKKLLLLKAEADDATKAPYVLKLTGNSDDLNMAFLDAVAKYKELQAFFDSDQLQAKMGTEDFTASLTKMAVEWEALSALINKGVTVGLTDKQALAAIAETAAMASAVDKLKSDYDDAALAADTAAVASERFARTFVTEGTGGGAFWGLGSKINLFGGALGDNLIGSVASWHVLADAAIEVLAVWTPALIGLGIAAAGAWPDIDLLYQHLEQTNTVAQAFGARVGFMNGALTGAVGPFQKLQNAMNPGVVELFGDALDVATHKAGVFSQIALGVEHTIDQWGAQGVLALNSGAGSKFLSGMVTDFTDLGNSIKYFFGDIGDLVQQMPGVAHVLLDVGSGFLQVAGDVIKSTDPLAKFVMGLHGAILWGGLMFTVLVRLYQGAIEPLFMAIVGKLVPAFALLKAGDFANFFGAIGDMVSPTTLLIAGLVAAGAAFYAADKAATAFNTTLENKLAQTALPGLTAGLAAAIAQSRAYDASVNSAIAHPGGIESGLDNNMITGPMMTALHWLDSDKANSGLTQVQQQAVNLKSNLAALGAQFGGLQNAESLATEAGVSFSEITGKGSYNLKLMETMIQGVISGMKGMGQTTGMIGNAENVMNAMNNTANSGVSDMQKVNSAYDQWTSMLTGSLSAFDTYDQGLQTLNTSGNSVTLTLGKMTDKFVQGHAAIDGLSKSDIALNQAFQSQVTSMNALYDTWRLAGVQGNVFAAGVRASIEPLMKYAEGSKSATAELAAMASEAGYNGPASFQALSVWLGKGKDGLGAVQKASQQATIQEALLTGALQGQGSVIENELLGDLDQAEVKYSGVTGAIQKYAYEIEKGDGATAAGHAARTQVIDDIVKMGLITHSTTGQIGAMISKLLDVPKKLAIQMVLNAEASLNIQEYIRATTVGGAHLRASGGLVPSGFPHDTWPALLTSGEAIVPAHLTPHVAPFLAAHGVPGFESGFVPRMASYTSSGGSYGDTHHWHIQGDTDPEGAAKRIIATVRKYKKDHGHQPTGIG